MQQDLSLLPNLDTCTATEQQQNISIINISYSVLHYSLALGKEISIYKYHSNKCQGYYYYYYYYYYYLDCVRGYPGEPVPESKTNLDLLEQ